MLSLNDWIELLEEGHNLKIYIWSRFDVANALDLNLKHRIHNNALCNYVKESSDGLKNCMRCRTCADNLARKRGCFSAYCIHGVLEIISPVLLNGKWVATVYISNLCGDKCEYERRIRRACSKYSISYEHAVSLIENGEYKFNLSNLEKLAAGLTEIVYEKLQNIKHVDPAVPEPVKKLFDLAEDYYSSETIKSVSVRYGINEKYLGYLFKKSAGMSFCEYKNMLRLDEAAYMLKGSNLKIIDIAVSTGFANVSYFTKKFRTTFGVSPTEYRKKHLKSL